MYKYVLKLKKYFKTYSNICTTTVVEINKDAAFL